MRRTLVRDRQRPRPSTGVVTTIDETVWPYMRNLSRVASSSGMVAACTLMRKQSSPVMRWHSVTWSSDSARAAILVSWRAAGRTRTNAATGSPTAAGSTPMLKPVITPARCIRCTRSVTAGADMPTLRASADMVIRGSACSSRSSSRLTSSSWSRSDMRFAFDLKVIGLVCLQVRLQHPHHATDDGAMATTTSPRHPIAVGGGLVVVGATFHYLGPSFAVLLFAHLDAMGVAWLRMASAALVLALVRPPWTVWRAAGRDERVLVVALGGVLAAMNATFYLALDRLPLATVAGIEFLGVIALAAYGARTRRNACALALTVAGVALLIQVRIAGTPVGLVLAAANCVGFMLYVLIGHRLANVPSDRRSAALDRLSLVVAIGAVASTPLGIGAALPAVHHPTWLLWGLGVGVCSTVIPYLADQLAMVRLPRATYSLMLALLPVTATVCGIAVLHQLPGQPGPGRARTGGRGRRRPPT